MCASFVVLEVSAGREGNVDAIPARLVHYSGTHELLINREVSHHAVSGMCEMHNQSMPCKAASR